MPSPPLRFREGLAALGNPWSERLRVRPPGEGGGPAYLVQSEFEGADGTALTAYVPEIGPPWTNETGVADLQGGRLRCITDGGRFLQNAGVGDLDLSVRFQLPAATGSYSASIEGRWASVNDHYLFQVIGDGTVRLLDYKEGVLAIRQPTTWVADAAEHTLRLLAADQEMHLYLDGALKVSWVSFWNEAVGTFGLRGNPNVMFDAWRGVAPTMPWAGAAMLLLASGDSITASPTNAPLTAPTRLGTNLTTVGTWGTVKAINRGYSGSNSLTWTPPYAPLPAAIATATAAGMLDQPVGQRAVQIMIGTNDAEDSLAISNAAYQANVDNQVGAWLAAGFAPIILHAPPGFTVGAYSAGFSAAALARVQGYLAPLQAIVAARAGTDTYPGGGPKVFLGDTQARTYFASHPEELGDGLHPNAVGAATLAGFWATALTGIL